MFEVTPNFLRSLIPNYLICAVLPGWSHEYMKSEEANNDIPDAPEHRFSRINALRLCRPAVSLTSRISSQWYG
ncbi:hypothetical protein ASPCADRAFT_211984 [Aspergillus carbonarius ITEM 5010]|uniref:Uncharacterized protein n=1 Tax=Aspergillus carbonarius (strain ITEM 5010) TaxID=602072 RepID=A0A1R3R7M6_ASPC5|nr:hypothetical protein ASPCADRAFT_211984 [Aspergillus carbonarius ITEM 5010]